MEYIIPETNLITVAKENFDNSTKYIIEPLSPGFGVTLGNSLRRVLLSSLPGSAITTIKIDGVSHEFTSIQGLKEDMVELILNLKKIKVKSHSEDPVTLTLDVKGAKKITSDDFSKNPTIEFIPNQYIGTLADKSKLKAEITVEQGRGYVSSDAKKEQKLPLGTIALDCIFSPIEKVNFLVENTRVGRITNYDKLILEITTDGTISSEEALNSSLKILSDHMLKIMESDNLIIKAKEEKTAKKKAKLKTKDES